MEEKDSWHEWKNLVLETGGQLLSFVAQGGARDLCLNWSLKGSNGKGHATTRNCKFYCYVCLEACVLHSKRAANSCGSKLVIYQYLMTNALPNLN